MIELISRDAADREVGDVRADSMDAADGEVGDDRADSGDVADEGGERDDSADSNVGLMEWTFFDDGAVGSAQSLCDGVEDAGRSLSKRPKEQSEEV